MSSIKMDFTEEDIMIGLYKLAFIAAGKLMNIDLNKLEKASGRKLKLSTIVTFAKLGAESDEEREFVRVCEGVIG